MSTPTGTPDETFGEWPVRRLVSDVVGSGPKSAEDMTRGQAREALERILAGEPAHTTLGAFWLANRWKRNTPVELAAFTDVMRERSVATAEPDCDPVDCGANYDGKHTSALLGVAAGLVSAAAGVPVVAHSGDRVPSQEDVAYKHVLDELGVRTFLNTVETLANPANADAFTGADVRRYREAMARSGSLLPGAETRDETVRVPTLIVWGERDRALSTDLLDGLEAWVPELRVERLPAASHWVQADEPAG